MSLKELSENKINIADLQPVEAKRYDARRQFRILEQTKLYNKLLGRWNWFMTENQAEINSNLFSQNQLLGILVQGLFDKKEAEKQFKALKQTGLYDETRKQWNTSMNKDRTVDSDQRHSASQLYGILVESLFDKKEAERQFNALKQTELYDKDQEMWNQWMREDQTKIVGNLFSPDQLLGILVQGLFDKEEAERQFRELKRWTNFYNEERRGWGWEHVRDRRYKADIFSQDQLLGILVEGFFDKEEAREQLKILKSTSLYDKDLGQWNESMLKDRTLNSSRRFARDQLLGILVERTLEEEDFSPGKEEPLPSVRSF